MHGFRRGRGGFVARIGTSERQIVARVVADTAQLLGHPVTDDAGETSVVEGDVPPWPVLETDDVVPPTDPALARLLPSASLDDDAVALEFRRLTENEVRAQKAERLALVWRSLQTDASRVVVAPGDAPAWAAALTDVRLVLAERLGIEDDEDAEDVYVGAQDGAFDGDEVARAMATLYAALSWLQETLLQAMLGELGDDGTD
ncbi:conserved hypothetical protein [Beutenbergia cavernae DSM 12333]|uniref:Uncharacterized protein n=1 Tax=Beutenbergia cavernae (strain ATCC BAA-8 / DSM 12333 / CCUG 43141 / JCM 11478 / NBRC 16432 / NCIMB 13614 / HKI 0122) TaxID=471853 RepID=C5BY85_BEUC1|nr:DUF2017 domain-containing protein [Beutenbergia cavernae]ACQ80985.1 conserved hypothetical protein [Beutenbergia cavernae DSM 12333]